jgi:hypothetical protein
MIINVNYPSYFNETWTFWTYFSKNTQVSNLMKIRPVGQRGRTDGQAADTHDEANSRFRSFTNASTKGHQVLDSTL